MAGIIKDLTNQRFGRLLVLRFAGKSGKRATWLCQCDCGNQTAVLSQSLTSTNGLTRSCGCLQKELRRKQFSNPSTNPNFKHGHTKNRKRSPENIAFCAARARCRNPKNDTYSYYGGRGIEFHYESFESFFADVGSRPGPKYSLDRINPDGHYEPGNCKWATKREQTDNQRRNYSEWLVHVHLSD